jgi:hypothetical protein
MNKKPLNLLQRNFVTGLMIVGLIIAGFFALRTARAFRQFHGHRPPPHFAPERVETDVELIRDWMTLPYISITYGLPPDLLYEKLDIPPDKAKKKSLMQLNNQYFPGEPGILLEKVKAVILEYQATLTPAPLSTSRPASNP